MPNDAFESYTRSASFALTLSSPQIGRLLTKAKIAELTERFPWYGDSRTEINFGTVEEAVAGQMDSTNRALVRKGLLEVVVPESLPCQRESIVVLTTAGRLTVGLLIEAGFAVDPRSVPSVFCHPDDRIKLTPTLDHWEVSDRPHDRRWDYMQPGDEAFMDAGHGPRPDRVTT